MTEQNQHSSDLKPAWSEVPTAVVENLSRIVKDRIDSGHIVQGGYGPSAAYVVRTAGGRQFFCKGNHPGVPKQSRAAVHRERFLYEQLPELDSFRPSMQGFVECGDWELLVLEFLDRGIPVPPWSEATFQACVELLARLHTSMPSHARRVLANGVWSQVSQAQVGWRYLALHDEEFGRLRSLFVDPNAGGRWLERYISTFGDLEKEAASLQAPSSWIHCDVRSDNLIFAHDGKPKLLDWPMLSLGPALLDLAFFLPSVAGEGGPSPGQGLALYERNVGRKFDEHGLRVIVAIVAGFFAARAGEPPMPELPRLRWLQSLYLAPCLIWVSSLLGIDPPPPLESPSGK